MSEEGVIYCATRRIHTREKLEKYPNLTELHAAARPHANWYLPVPENSTSTNNRDSCGQPSHLRS
jgi:hypothetical protein